MKIETKLRFRLWLSLSMLLVLAGGVGVFIRHIKKEHQIDGAPQTLRYAFMLNEEVWKILSSNKRLSVSKPLPPISKKPRVNGLLGLQSNFDLKNYTVKVNTGSSSQLFPLAAFYVVPKVSFSTDFRCIEGWSEETQYAGAKFSDFLSFYNLGKKSDGNYYAYVGFVTPDRKYYVSIDMESMLHDQTVLAYEMNGRSLDIKNGAPLRLVIPIKYGIKSLKRIGSIIFSDTRPPDYWAERGYDWYSGL